MDSDCQIPNWKQCCCTCRNQKTIFKHPWNKGEGKGSILDVMGYGCAVPEFEDCEDGTRPIIFSERKHGMCEMWMKREQTELISNEAETK